MSLEAFSRDDLDRAGYTIPGEQRDKTVTPVFKYLSVLNAPQSMLQNKPVHDLKEVVEIRFAADRNYMPIMGVDEPFAVDDDTGRVITWAERYKAQYQAFLAGSEQEAEGTPLEELTSYGISQSQLSLCRALNIYSIEALAHIEGAGRKRLGQHGNDLIPMAAKYLAARRDGSQLQTEVNELKRQLAAMREGQMAGLGEEVVLSTVVPDLVPPMPVEEEMSHEAMKDEIQRLTGARPRGAPRSDTLRNMLEQARAG